MYITLVPLHNLFVFFIDYPTISQFYLFYSAQNNLTRIILLCRLSQQNILSSMILQNILSRMILKNILGRMILQNILSRIILLFRLSQQNILSKMILQNILNRMILLRILYRLILSRVILSSRIILFFIDSVGENQLILLNSTIFNIFESETSTIFILFLFPLILITFI